MMMAYHRRVSPDGLSIQFTSNGELKLRYTHFRADGWPLCPQCDEDELYSDIMLGWIGIGPRPTLQACLDGRMSCYLCHWTSEP
jgi:hypothetical protein